MNDTIAAVATGAGCGIGIVRISGPDALAVGSRMFRGRGGRALEATPVSRLTLGTIVDPASGRQIDEALAVHMRAGRSYTGEATVEIQCHGGRGTLEAVLQAAVDAGARPAAPGEFTKRAFLSGRIDLSQAEAVAELIAAETQAARGAALTRLRGGLGERVRSLAGRLLDEIAAAEALLDHGDEDVASTGPDIGAIQSVAGELMQLIAAGEGLDDGLRLPRVVIAGKTNSGKSSIFNMLCEKERSIVSPSPGTTRDYIEERFPLEGRQVTLVDTAGLRQTFDPVESEGIERSRRQMLDADHLLLTIDASVPLDADDVRLIEEFRGRAPLIVLTKADLPSRVDRGELAAGCATGMSIFPVSALDRNGSRELARAVVERCRERAPGDDAAAPNLRQRDALCAAAASLGRAIELLAPGQSLLDQAVAELRWAADSLGEITGDAASEAVLERVFSQFCIGK